MELFIVSHERSASWGAGIIGNPGSLERAAHTKYTIAFSLRVSILKMRVIFRRADLG